ncbi:hypothetical protein BDQ17DRAFT_1332666 [Cyathus striatus]|nr:hypothetical protein BDQ17DRAFT_1332666 [Cyathus striatus]
MIYPIPFTHAVVHIEREHEYNTHAQVILCKQQQTRMSVIGTPIMLVLKLKQIGWSNFHAQTLSVHAQLTLTFENLYRELTSEYELRDLRILVLEELFPITKVTDDAAKFGHYWLYSELNILHCDISEKNMMYREEGGVIYGVLNDFDLCKKMDNNLSGPSSRQRTGTIPFLAIDLLSRPKAPPAHRYRHDVESFFYVFYYIITSYDKNALISNPPLEWWFTDVPLNVSKGKSQDFFLNLHHDPTPTFREFEDYSLEMFEAIRRGYYVFHSGQDIETGDGDISYEKFSKVFKKIASL